MSVICLRAFGSVKGDAKGGLARRLRNGVVICGIGVMGPGLVMAGTGGHDAESFKLSKSRPSTVISSALAECLLRLGDLEEATSLLEAAATEIEGLEGIEATRERVRIRELLGVRDG